MDVVSFMEIEEDEKDLIISFALDDEDGDIKSLISEPRTCSWA